MKDLELKIYKDLIEVRPYTYNAFYDDIRERDKFEDYLIENYKNLDFSRVDKFVNYIYEVIDKMDYLFINELEDSKYLNNYLNNLEYIHYDKIFLEGDIKYPYNTRYLFNIKSKKAKQFIKNNIKFNLSDECREPMLVETDRKYILNVDGSKNGIIEENGRKIFKIEDVYCEYGFVKDEYLQLVLCQQDGYIYDYRDIDELTFLKRKDLKVENNSYASYDYKKFSNDINDDKYINYIYDIIDNTDYVFGDCLLYNEEMEYRNKLNHMYYDKILLEDKSKGFKTNYIFKIKDKKSKQFVKNHIKFNISNKEKEPIIVDTNKNYILNEINRQDHEYYNYGFIKDGSLKVILHQKDGYIDDYRPTSKI